MATDADLQTDTSSVTDPLRDIRMESGHDLGRVFRDWMALSVFALEGNDQDYLERLDRYSRDPNGEATRKTAARLFSASLGELIRITVDAQRPVLGDVYEEIGNQADDLGQFFTPWNVCNLKAGMLISAEDAEEATPSDPLRVADPACGSGRLLLAVAKSLHKQDPDASILVQGTDKDRTCARMAVVNLAIANVPGRIRHGNSLTQEIHETWHIVPDSHERTVQRVDATESQSEAEGDAAYKQIQLPATGDGDE